MSVTNECAALEASIMVNDPNFPALSARYHELEDGLFVMIGALAAVAYEFSFNQAPAEKETSDPPLLDGNPAWRAVSVMVKF
jgi:hypothetical protein